MEEIIIGLASGIGLLALSYLNTRFSLLRRAWNRLHGHRPARPMRYSGGLERYRDWKEDQER